MKYAILVLCMATRLASAEDLMVLSAGAVQPGLAGLTEQFTRETRKKVRVQYATAPQLEKRLAGGELADVLVAPLGVMNEQLRRGRVDSEAHFVIGRVGVGVAIRSGNFEPDIASLEQFKQSILGADSIVYNQASTGLYLETLFDLLGIGDQLKIRTTRYPTGAQVLEHVIGGKGYEIGFGAITEIRLFERRGVKYIGPLPDQIQHRTAYVAGLMTEAPTADVAQDFLRFLGTPSAKAILAAAGIE